MAPVFRALVNRPFLRTDRVCLYANWLDGGMVPGECGIALYTLLCILFQPPTVWFLIVGVITVWHNIKSGKIPWLNSSSETSKKTSRLDSGVRQIVTATAWRKRCATSSATPWGLRDAPPLRSAAA